MSNKFTSGRNPQRHPGVCKSKKKPDPTMCPIVWPETMIAHCLWSITWPNSFHMEADYWLTLRRQVSTLWAANNVQIPPSLGLPFGSVANASFAVTEQTCFYQTGSSLIISQSFPFFAGINETGQYVGGDPFYYDSGQASLGAFFTGFGQIAIRNGPN